MQANSNDKQAVKELWAYAFDEQEPFLSEYFDNFWKAENALVIKENSSLAGALEMIPYTVFLKGAQLQAAYIVGVSVAQSFRGRGFSKALMRDCLTEHKNRGMAISLLIPFNYEFYKKLGYRLCYTLDIYELDTNNIPDMEKLSPVVKADLKDLDKLNAVYHNFCKDKNGYIIRTKHDWEYIFFEHRLFDGGFFAVESGNSFSGYMSYLKKNEEIFVRELVYSDINSLMSLFAKLKEYTKIKVRTASDNFLLKLLPNPKNVLKTIPTVMARITDIKKVLSLFDTGDLKFKITDDLIEENCGIYHSYNGSIIKTDSDVFDISADIGSFTELVTGFSSSDELLLSGKLKANIKAREKLSEIFTKENNYINHLMEE